MASSANHLCCSGESKSNTSFGSSPVEKTPQANLSGNLSQNKVSSACRLRAAECCKHLLIDVWFAALSWKWGKERAVCYSLCFGRVSWFIRPCTAPAVHSAQVPLREAVAAPTSRQRWKSSLEALPCPSPVLGGIGP